MKNEYARILDKAYKFFFRKGHVQDLKGHPMLHEPAFVCISSTVLPSMKKDWVYHVKIIIHQSLCSVKEVDCTWTAGLSGCCYHVTGTLFCLENYIYQGLQEEEKKGCPEHLQVWTKPVTKCVTGRPTDKVKLKKIMYDIERRPKLHSIDEWDCRPLLKGIIDPNKAQNLRDRLTSMQQKN